MNDPDLALDSAPNAGPASQPPSRSSAPPCSEPEPAGAPASSAEASGGTPEERQFSGLVRRVLQRRLPTATAGAAAPAAAGVGLATIFSRSSEAAVSGSPFDSALVRLVNRVNGSFDIGEYIKVASMGAQGYIDEQLAPLGIADEPFESIVAGSAPQVRALLDPGNGGAELRLNPGLTATNRLFQLLTLARQITSPRRLQERMVEFWADHLSVDLFAKSIGPNKAAEDRELDRPLALGDFHSLLRNSAGSVSMMIYLDNAFSGFALDATGQPVNEGYNENYARELLELHTLGVNTGYTEDDIKRVAAFLAGWSTTEAQNPALMPPQWSFVYDPSRHFTTEPGGEILLGTSKKVKVSPAGGTPFGLNQGQELLEQLASHPDTARYVTGKLLRWFVTYDIDDPLFAPVRQQLESLWQSQSNSIDPLIRELLDLELLKLQGPELSGLKLKRPQAFATGLARALGFTLDPIAFSAAGFAELADDLDVLGHGPFAWGPPNGYPDSEEAWVGGLYSRWNLANKLLRNGYTEGPVGLRITDAQIDYLYAGATQGQEGRHLNYLLTGGCMTAFEEQQIDAFFLHFFGPGAPPLPAGKEYIVLRDGLALAACTPTYQYY